MSVSSGFFVLTNHSLFNTLCTCVSTPIYGASSVIAKKTFAVFIHTHGSLTNSSMVFGILSSFSTKILQVAKIFLALLLKNPRVLMQDLIFSTHKATPSSGVFKILNNFSVALFTCLSVV
ncbi:MAG: hypothetical protein LBF15_02770 [Candidatus Peribacteria bacterium]|nr:hypothetical protein [Candidatus Peribacteria bacterium]